MRRGLLTCLLKLSCAHAVLAGLAGCASAPLTASGSLASYDGLAPAEGVVTKSRLRVDKADILAARRVAIVPTSYSSAAARAELTVRQRHVIANAVDRSGCIGLSDRFEVVPPGQTADLAVHGTITDVTVTNAAVAARGKAEIRGVRCLWTHWRTGVPGRKGIGVAAGVGRRCRDGNPVTGNSSRPEIVALMSGRAINAAIFRLLA